MRFSAALLSGVAASVVAALALAFFGHGIGGFHGEVALASLCFGIGGGILVWRVIPVGKTSCPKSFWEWVMIAVFTCASARAFFWLLYEDGDQWKILSPNNLGDMSIHLTFIHWMAKTTHWWPASPILAGDPLRYPPGSDLFNSLLLIAGAPLIQGLLWCALTGAALTGTALWRWGRGMALAALLFNGGLAGVVLLKGENPDALSEWKNLFLTLFVTQRGFLFALPAGLLLLTAWREENFGTEKKIVLPLPVQMLLLAVIPLFSVHSALSLGAAMVGVILFSPSETSRLRLLKLALVAWPVMAFFGWLVATGAGGPSAVHALGWQVGWTSDGSVGFWFWNFGLALPLGLFLSVSLFRKNASREARAFVWPAAFLFAVCLFVRFAPWAWDNMKLMLWSWIVIAPYLWRELIARWSVAFRVVTLLLLFGSGAVTLVAGLDGRHGYELIKKSDLQETSWVLRDIPPDAVIACAPEYNHPVLLLGHPVLAGYDGHLWSHGLDYQARYAALNSIMNGESGWEKKARSLGVEYIYWSPLEAARWPESKLPLAKGWAGVSPCCLHL